MQIRDLEAVDAVYRNKSFSEASYEMNFSLSAISKQVSRAERELGFEIFEARVKGQPLKTTQEGSVVMPAIQKIVQQYRNLMEQVRDMTDDSPVSISVGIVPFIGTIGENEILSRFSIHDPEVSVRVIHDNNSNLLRMLDDGDLDAAFLLITELSTMNRQLWEMLTEEEHKMIKVMQNDQLTVGVCADHPLAGRDSIKLDEIKDELFVYPLSNEDSIRKGRAKILQSMLSDKSFKLTPMYMDCTNKDLVLSVVEKGKAVLPVITRPVEYSQNIKYIKVENWPNQATGLFVYKKNSSSTHLRSLIKFAREYAAANMIPADEKRPE